MENNLEMCWNCMHRRDEHFIEGTLRNACRVHNCGCGKWVAPKKEKESTEVRDEKIARIVKEFREVFSLHHVPDEIIEGKLSTFEAWLTQTLTTLLNEE